MMPVIFTVGFLVYEHHDKMIDLYRAAYPVDPVKAAALDTCAENMNFNRLDSGDRASCYAGTYGRQAAPALVPTPQPTYVYSPSHLPGNDIRRQEANSSYLQGAQANPAAPPPIPPAPQHPPQHRPGSMPLATNRQ
jgi:hypothetical protein